MLELTRDQILAHRRTVSVLDRRLAYSAQSLETAAAAGFQDSVPRSALLSIHARVAGTRPDTWQEPPLIQVWGPRFSAYVIAEKDLAVFTLGRMSERPEARHRAEDIADRLETALAGETMDCRDVARIVGVQPNQLRYAAPTGRFLIYWDGARQPLIQSVSAPDIEPGEARKELARRHLSVLGPSTPESFGAWAGVKPNSAEAAFDSLAEELIAVQTPIGEGWILASDELSFRTADGAGSTRLLPSGDPYYLLRGEDRALLVPDPAQREQLWTSRVWPGAVLVDTEVVGTWRRSGAQVTIETWRSLTAADREAVENEAMSMPLPGVEGQVTVTWPDT